MRKIESLLHTENNVIYFSKNSKAEEYCFRNSTALAINGSILFISDAAILKLAINKAIKKLHILVEVDTFEEFERIEELLLSKENIEFSVVLNKEVDWLQKIKSPVNVFTFPICFNTFFKNIVKKETKINTSEMKIRDIELYQNTLYSNNVDLLKEYSKEFLRVSNKLEIKQLKMILRDNEQLFDFSLFEKLHHDIQFYFKSFFEMNASCRTTYLKEFSRKLLLTYHCLMPEIKIFKPIFIHIFEKLPVSVASDILQHFLELELKIIGIELRNYIPLKINHKNSYIIECCNHILMSSVSDKLGNLINLIEQKAYLNSKLIKELDSTLSENKNNCQCCNNIKTIQIVDAIKEAGTPVQVLKDFSTLQSKMFRSYKNEIDSNCSGRDIVEMLEFVFVNGFKTKNSHIEIALINEINEFYRFNINEYIIVNSIYAILENAIEAKAREISIKLFLDQHKKINIDICHNGSQITTTEAKYIFNKCFTRKSGHFGNGLNIARDWLRTNDYDLIFCEDTHCFKITVCKPREE